MDAEEVLSICWNAFIKTQSKKLVSLSRFLATLWFERDHPDLDSWLHRLGEQQTIVNHLAREFMSDIHHVCSQTCEEEDSTKLQEYLLEGRGWQLMYAIKRVGLQGLSCNKELASLIVSLMPVSQQFKVQSDAPYEFSHVPAHEFITDADLQEYTQTPKPTKTTTTSHSSSSHKHSRHRTPSDAHPKLDQSKVGYIRLSNDSVTYETSDSDDGENVRSTKFTTSGRSLKWRTVTIHPYTTDYDDEVTRILLRPIAEIPPLDSHSLCNLFLDLLRMLCENDRNLSSPPKFVSGNLLPQLLCMLENTSKVDEYITSEEDRIRCMMGLVNVVLTSASGTVTQQNGINIILLHKTLIRLLKIMQLLIMKHKCNEPFENQQELSPLSELTMTFVYRTTIGIAVLLISIFKHLQTNLSLMNSSVRIMSNFQEFKGYEYLNMILEYVTFLNVKKVINTVSKTGGVVIINVLAKLVEALKNVKVAYVHGIACTKEKHRKCDFSRYLHHHHDIMCKAKVSDSIPHFATTADGNTCTVATAVLSLLAVLNYVKNKHQQILVLSSVMKCGICCCIPLEKIVCIIIDLLPAVSTSVRNKLFIMLDTIVFDQLYAGVELENLPHKPCKLCSSDFGDDLVSDVTCSGNILDSGISSNEELRNRSSNFDTQNKKHNPWKSLQLLKKLISDGNNPCTAMVTAKNLAIFTSKGNHDIRELIFQDIFLPLFLAFQSLIGESEDSTSDTEPVSLNLPYSVKYHIITALPFALQEQSNLTLFHQNNGFTKLCSLLDDVSLRSEVLSVIEAMVHLEEKHRLMQTVNRRRETHSNKDSLISRAFINIIISKNSTGENFTDTTVTDTLDTDSGLETIKQKPTQDVVLLTDLWRTCRNLCFTCTFFFRTFAESQCSMLVYDKLYETLATISGDQTVNDNVTPSNKSASVDLKLQEQIKTDISTNIQTAPSASSVSTGLIQKPNQTETPTIEMIRTEISTNENATPSISSVSDGLSNDELKQHLTILEQLLSLGFCVLGYNAGALYSKQVTIDHKLLTTVESSLLVCTQWSMTNKRLLFDVLLSSAGALRSTTKKATPVTERDLVEEMCAESLSSSDDSSCVNETEKGYENDTTSSVQSLSRQTSTDHHTPTHHNHPHTPHPIAPIYRIIIKLLIAVSGESTDTSTPLLHHIIGRLNSVCRDSPQHRAAISSQGILELVLRGFETHITMANDTGDLHESVLELVQLLGKNNITTQELQLYLRCFLEASSPEKSLLNNLIEVVDNSGISPHYFLEFPVVQDKSTASIFGADPSFIDNPLSLGALHQGTPECLPWHTYQISFTVSVWLQYADTHVTTRKENGRVTNKATLPTYCTYHVFSLGNTEKQFEIWLNTTTGSIIIRLTSELYDSHYVLKEFDWSGCMAKDEWHHLVFMYSEALDGSTLIGKMTMVVDGCDTRDFIIDHPALKLTSLCPGLTLGHVISHPQACSSTGCVRIGNLSIYKGSNLDPSFSLHLYTLGPNTPSITKCDCDNLAVQYSPSLLKKMVLGSSVSYDVLVGSKPLDLHSAQESLIISFTPQFPNQICHYKSLLTSDPSAPSNPEKRLLAQKPAVTMATTHCTLTPTMHCNLEQTITDSGGIGTFMFLVAKVVEGRGKPQQVTYTQIIQSLSVKLLFSIIDRMPRLLKSFEKSSGYAMLAKILTSSRAQIGYHTLRVILDAATSETLLRYDKTTDKFILRKSTEAVVKNSQVISELLLSWRIWEKADDGVTQMLFSALEMLVSDKHPYKEFNSRQFLTANIIDKMFLVYEERIQENTYALSSSVSQSVVRIIESLVGAPPDLHTIMSICDFLLIIHPAASTYVYHERQNFYFSLWWALPTSMKQNRVDELKSVREKSKNHTSISREYLSATDSPVGSPHVGMRQSFSLPSMVSIADDNHNSDTSSNTDDELLHLYPPVSLRKSQTKPSPKTRKRISSEDFIEISAYDVEIDKNTELLSEICQYEAEALDYEIINSGLHTTDDHVTQPEEITDSIAETNKNPTVIQPHAQSPAENRQSVPSLQSIAKCSVTNFLTAHKNLCFRSRLGSDTALLHEQIIDNIVHGHGDDSESQTSQNNQKSDNDCSGQYYVQAKTVESHQTFDNQSQGLDSDVQTLAFNRFSPDDLSRIEANRENTETQKNTIESREQRRQSSININNTDKPQNVTESREQSRQSSINIRNTETQHSTIDGTKPSRQNTVDTSVTQSNIDSTENGINSEVLDDDSLNLMPSRDDSLNLVSSGESTNGNGETKSVTSTQLQEEGVNTLSAGLLDLVSGVIVNLPDSMVERTLSKIVRPEVLVILAHNPCNLVRAAAISVVDAYMRRATPPQQEHFLKKELFQLLCLQLHQYPTSEIVINSILTFLLDKNTSVDESFEADSLNNHSGLVMLVSTIEVTLHDPTLCHNLLAVIAKIVESSMTASSVLIEVALVESLCNLLAGVNGQTHSVSGVSHYQQFEDLITLLKCLDDRETNLYGPESPQAIHICRILSHILNKLLDYTETIAEDRSQPMAWFKNQTSYLERFESLKSLLKSPFSLHSNHPEPSVNTEQKPPITTKQKPKAKSLPSPKPALPSPDDNGKLRSKISSVFDFFVDGTDFYFGTMPGTDDVIRDNVLTGSQTAPAGKQLGNPAAGSSQYHINQGAMSYYVNNGEITSQSALPASSLVIATKDVPLSSRVMPAFFKQKRKLPICITQSELIDRLKKILPLATDLITFAVDSKDSLDDRRRRLPPLVDGSHDVNDWQLFQRHMLLFLYKSIAACLEKGFFGRSKNVVMSSVKDVTKQQLSRLLLTMLSPHQCFVQRIFTLSYLCGEPQFPDVFRMLLNSQTFGIRFGVSLYDLLTTWKSRITTQQYSHGCSLITILRQATFSVPSTLKPIRQSEAAKLKQIQDTWFSEKKEARAVWAKRLGVSLQRICQKHDGLMRQLSANAMETTQLVTQLQKVERQKICQKHDGLMRQLSANAMETTQLVTQLQKVERQKFVDHVKKGMTIRVHVKKLWQDLVQQLTHERAVWHTPHSYPQSWQVDPTEGPCRVRRRLQRCHLTINEEFLLPSSRHRRKAALTDPPLLYLFEEDHHSSDSAALIYRLYTNEKIQSTYKCVTVTPANENAGDLFVGEHSIYFVADEAISHTNYTQVLLGNKDQLSMTWPHVDIKELHRRWYMLRDIGLEIFLTNGKTCLLAFDSDKDRDDLLQSILALELPNLIQSENIAAIEQLWASGHLSNFEYLTHLNKMAGRSFNDLMQYPVLPYVISDYTSDRIDLGNPAIYRDFSKPVAVQHRSREEKYRRNYEYLAGEYSKADSESLTFRVEPYHYGSHYSNSGTVLQFLVRLPPYTQMFLAYQDNSFDLPDRTFHSMETSWRLASFQSPTDVKELIPEFFYLPEFLINAEGFEFGKRQNGTQVSDVSLPPWCNHNPRLFTLVHRQALESAYVTQQVHNWIDLVFGYKQSGEPAVQAINVFHPATYFGVNVDAIKDPVRRIALETMIKTYGQTPKQLFAKSPHPSINQTDPTQLTGIMTHIFSKTVTPTPQYLSHKLSPLPTIEGLQWGSYLGSPDCPDPVATWKKTYERTVASLVALPTGDVFGIGTNACLLVMYSKERGVLSMYSTNVVWAAIVSWGHEDNILRVKNRQDRPTINFLHDNPYNQVRCCASVPDCRLLFMGGTTGVISVYTTACNVAKESDIQVFGLPRCLYGHSAAVNSIQVCKAYSVLVSCSDDKTCIIWDLNRLMYVTSITSHKSPVKALAVSETLGDIASVSDHAMGSCLQLHTVNGHYITKLYVEETVLCVAYSAAPEGRSVNVVAGGLSSGSIRMWSSWDLTPVRDLQHPSLANTPVVSLTFTPNSQRLYASNANGTVTIWENSPPNTRWPGPMFIPFL